MGNWVLVPCLAALRTEFNTVAPRRDKGADGSIGDSNHNSSSDHTPDEDSAILRDHDADDKNEVHALDIDSSGPWPQGFDFVEKVRAIKAREFARGAKSRLQYVICNGLIANIDVKEGAWRVYSGVDPHTNHAHFSARYKTAQENDTSSWGVADGIEDDMALADDKIKITESTAKRIGKATGAEVDAATLLQLAVIFAKDSAVDGDAVQGLVKTLIEAVNAQSATLSVIRESIDQVDEQTAARIFEGSNDELAAVLLAALGRTRTQDLARLILSTQG